jgi:hypothetical protein
MVAALGLLIPAVVEDELVLVEVQLSAAKFKASKAMDIFFM